VQSNHGLFVLSFGFRIEEPSFLIGFEQKRGAIATQGRSYGEVFCRSVLVTRWVGPPQRVGSSTILIWFDFKREAIATRGRSYGEVFVGACWSRDGWVRRSDLDRPPF